jgi:hypothetical protein
MFIAKDVEEEGCEGMYRTSKPSWRSWVKRRKTWNKIDVLQDERLDSFRQNTRQQGYQLSGDVGSIQYRPVYVMSLLIPATICVKRHI